jgi:phosphatidylserine/phosphatidylglycerophosphate/cardiolipin synthase-like enzyme
MIRAEGEMTRKTLKRNQPAELPADDSDDFSAQSAPLAWLSAHRWKAAAAVTVGAVGLAVGTGLIDLGTITSWSAQNAPHRSDAAATAAPQTAAPAAAVASKPELRTCFTPGENCMGLIVAQIDRAKSEILVQAYSFKAKPLISALGRAHTRGVKVRVILDRADERAHDRAGSRLIAERILPQVDTGVASAHNKVMIIDRDSVITGSFNFTEAAQKTNAENVLLIKGHPDVAAAYVKNWQRRLAASRPYYGTMAPVL